MGNATCRPDQRDLTGIIHVTMSTNQFCIIFERMIIMVRQCYHSMRIIYHAYYGLGKRRANLPLIKLNFSISNTFLRQHAV